MEKDISAHFNFYLKIENWKMTKNPCMESIIQKVNFLKNEICVFSFFKFWSMELNFIFIFCEIRILISIWVSIKIETKFEFMEFHCGVKEPLLDVCFVLCLILFNDFYFEQTVALRQAKWIVGKWIVKMFQRRQHDYRRIDSCFHKNLSGGVFEVHVSRSFSKQKKITFRETELFIFWWSTVITQ